VGTISGDTLEVLEAPGNDLSRIEPGRDISSIETAGELLGAQRPRPIRHRARPSWITARKQRSGCTGPDVSLASGGVLGYKLWRCSGQRSLHMRSAMWSPGTSVRCNSSFPLQSGLGYFLYLPVWRRNCIQKSADGFIDRNYVIAGTPKSAGQVRLGCANKGLWGWMRSVPDRGAKALSR